MTDTPNGQLDQSQPQVAILAQYIKDLSFENPNAPRSLQADPQNQPRIDLTVNVGATLAGEDVYDVDLKMQAVAKTDELTLFVVDLLYSGLFMLRNIPADQLDPFLRVEAPRLLFPFARRIFADCTRDGGFPPLMLEPIDFLSIYLQARQQETGGTIEVEAPNN